MLSDPNNGEPSLGTLYRALNARLARAIQRAGGNRFDQAYQQLDELRIKLDAWADLVGVRRDVLELVDEDDGPLATASREAFLQLLEAMDHVETKLGLRDEPSDGSNLRPDALTHLRSLFQSLLMDKTGGFTRYASASRTVGGTQFKRSSDSPGSAVHSMPRSANPHFDAFLRRDVITDYAFRGTPPTPGPEIKREPVGTDSILHDGSDASHSRPSTAESAYKLASSSTYAESPTPSYPSISQLLSPSHRQGSLAQQTPSTASSSSSPLTPWTPYHSTSSSFLPTSPATGRQQHAPLMGHDRWTYVVLNPLQNEDSNQTPRAPKNIGPPMPVEPRMQPLYGSSSQNQPVFKSEGWLAGDDPRSSGHTAWRAP